MNQMCFQRVITKEKYKMNVLERGSTAWKGVYLSVWQTSVAAFVDVGMPDSSSRQAAETEISGRRRDAAASGQMKQGEANGST